MSAVPYSTAYDHHERLAPIAERIIGFSVEQVLWAYAPGRKNPQQRELGARIDARLADLGDRGWDVASLARIVGFRRWTFWDAQDRARRIRRGAPPAKNGRTGLKNAGHKRQQLASRDGGSHCFYCGRHMKLSTLTIDHVRPRSKGGTDALENLRLACEPCNQAKADQPWTPDALCGVA